MSFEPSTHREPLDEAHTQHRIPVGGAEVVQVINSGNAANPTLAPNDPSNRSFDAREGLKFKSPKGIESLWLDNEAGNAGDELILLILDRDDEVETAGGGAALVIQDSYPWESRIEYQDGSGNRQTVDPDNPLPVDDDALGSTSDASETDTSNSGSVIAWLQGVLEELQNDLSVVNGASALEVVQSTASNLLATVSQGTTPWTVQEQARSVVDEGQVSDDGSTSALAGADQGAVETTVQADPGNGDNLVIVTNATDGMVLKPGGSLTLPVDPSAISVRAASGTQQANYHATG